MWQTSASATRSLPRVGVDQYHPRGLACSVCHAYRRARAITSARPAPRLYYRTRIGYAVVSGIDRRQAQFPSWSPTYRSHVSHARLKMWS